VRRLIQLLPAHHVHDAVGAEALAIEQLMRKAGWQVDTYAEYIDEELTTSTRPIAELDTADAEGAAALYHLCITSPVAYTFAELPCRKALIYHNVTPPEYFEPWDRNLAEISRKTRRELEFLADKVNLAVGDSEFNRSELEDAGYRATRTVPILFDAGRYDCTPDPDMTAKLQGSANVIFVGRVVPNKAADDFIRVAAAHRDAGYPPARFVFAGKKHVLPGYTEKIDRLAAEADLDESRLLFTGSITQHELAALYRSASVFLSLSRHEGFMVPLLESMYYGVPVLALSRAAVPETLADAGMLFDDPDPEHVAALVARLLDDQILREDLIEGGRARLTRFDINRWGFVLKTALEGL
jgi:glycosyltransferase involved in cell wall biosynthesis